MFPHAVAVIRDHTYFAVQHTLANTAVYLCHQLRAGQPYRRSSAPPRARITTTTHIAFVSRPKCTIDPIWNGYSVPTCWGWLYWTTCTCNSGGPAHPSAIQQIGNTSGKGTAVLYTLNSGPEQFNTHAGPRSTLSISQERLALQRSRGIAVNPAISIYRALEVPKPCDKPCNNYTGGQLRRSTDKTFRPNTGDRYLEAIRRVFLATKDNSNK